jgi:hypothetical protein
VTQLGLWQPNFAGMHNSATMFFKAVTLAAWAALQRAP